jgi:hypothetical protein
LIFAQELHENGRGQALRDEPYQYRLSILKQADYSLLQLVPQGQQENI